MTRIIKVCPFCGSGLINRRCRHTASGQKYRCSACFKEFHIPSQREVNCKPGVGYVPKCLQKHFD